jgi:hypothetical protein
MPPHLTLLVYANQSNFKKHCLKALLELPRAKAWRPINGACPLHIGNDGLAWAFGWNSNLYETDLKFAPHRLDGRREFFAAPLGPTSQPLVVS